ncbi:MAG: glycoside hydrolase family 97 N-terminal domain-containing protein, partial [Phocaeicola sp.]|nr:glycoside hydrolase family 97 N-terminal domain-containing protein [Phocaeicola sp.]
MRKTFFATICLLLSMAIYASEVISPNGEIQVSFSLNGSVPTYQVSYKGQEVLRPSRLGFELVNGQNLLDGFTVL